MNLRAGGVGGACNDGGSVVFDVSIETIEADRVMRYSLSCDGSRLTYGAVLDLWENDMTFREFFTRVLAGSPFEAYRWETPVLSVKGIDREFGFVLIDASEFASREPDPHPFAAYFTSNDAHHGVVVFENLSGDATLAVPSPRTVLDAYGHLASFVREAPEVQIQELWKAIGATAKRLLGDAPVWISTAGDGVAWLHVRFDSVPKYYCYAPYCRAAK